MFASIARHRALFILAALLAIALLATEALAYRVSPLIHRLTPTGPGSTSSMTIDNPHDFPLTVEMTIERRNLENGVAVEDVSAEDEFLIFPPQAIVAPGARQKLQIRYVGGDVETAHFYRLRIAQIPIDLEESDTAQVKMSYHFLAAVYVEPEKAKPRLAVSSRTGENGATLLTIKNDGNGHASFGETDWVLGMSDGERITLAPGAIDTKTTPILEPGGTVELVVPAGQVTGEVTTLSLASG